MAPHISITRFVELLGRGASYLFLAIVVMSAIEVLMRYAMGQPTVWAHELSVALAATCFAIGGPFVHATRQHIAITFVYEQLAHNAKAWIRLLCSLLTLFFLLWLAYAAVQQGWLALKQGEMTGTALNWPIPAYLKTLFALCVSLMTLQTLLHIREDVARLRRRAS
jgi:TRAP-type mannitol/chloroaromatic compound transport system permease small subunit